MGRIWDLFLLCMGITPKSEVPDPTRHADATRRALEAEAERDRQQDRIAQPPPDEPSQHE